MGIGHWELMIIGVVIVLLFGHRLPGVMHSLGQGIRMFQNGFRGEESPRRAIPPFTASRKLV